MGTLKNQYLGNLRTEGTHIPSGNKIITDAPVDNMGKGEAFSPTGSFANPLGLSPPDLKDCWGATYSRCTTTGVYYRFTREQRRTVVWRSRAAIPLRLRTKQKSGVD